MADKGSDGPSLELPSFRFGRKRRRAEEPAEDAAESPEPDPTSVEPAETPDPQPQADATPVGSEPTAQPEPLPVPRSGKQRRRLSLPRLGTGAAVVVTGLLAGALLVAVAWASLHVCELVRGTSSCGGAGVVVLLAALALAVLLGRVLLGGFGVDDAGSISFLAIGLVAVIALLMSDLLLEWWMALVVPAVAVVSFWLAHWVSTAFVETTEDRMHR